MTRFYFDPPATPRKAPNPLRRLLIRCPATSKLVATGETIEEPLWAATANKTGKVICPHCAKPHRWVKEDIILAR
jgi:hypothetical protein